MRVPKLFLLKINLKLKIIQLWIKFNLVNYLMCKPVLESKICCLIVNHVYIALFSHNGIKQTRISMLIHNNINFCKKNVFDLKSFWPFPVIENLLLTIQVYRWACYFPIKIQIDKWGKMFAYMCSIFIWGGGVGSGELSFLFLVAQLIYDMISIYITILLSQIFNIWLFYSTLQWIVWEVL